jgi:hypothetical protein
VSGAKFQGFATESAAITWLRSGSPSSGSPQAQASATAREAHAHAAGGTRAYDGYGAHTYARPQVTCPLIHLTPPLTTTKVRRQPLVTIPSSTSRTRHCARKHPQSCRRTRARTHPPTHTHTVAHTHTHTHNTHTHTHTRMHTHTHTRSSSRLSPTESDRTMTILSLPAMTKTSMACTHTRRATVTSWPHRALLRRRQAMRNTPVLAQRRVPIALSCMLQRHTRTWGCLARSPRQHLSFPLVATRMGATRALGCHHPRAERGG